MKHHARTQHTGTIVKIDPSSGGAVTVEIDGALSTIKRKVCDGIVLHVGDHVAVERRHARIVHVTVIDERPARVSGERRAVIKTIAANGPGFAVDTQTGDAVRFSRHYFNDMPGFVVGATCAYELEMAGVGRLLRIVE